VSIFHPGTDRDLTSVERVGLAICQTSSNNDLWHAGVLHRSEEGKVQLLHLEYHRQLSNEDFKSQWSKYKFCWVIPNVPKPRMASLAAKCRLIWDRLGKSEIPYGFNYKETAFDRSGALKLGNSEIGLTCATFVLAVFKFEGFDILKQEEWPLRPADADVRKVIVAGLKNLA
jgi:hypothetical protein